MSTATNNEDKTAVRAKFMGWYGTLDQKEKDDLRPFFDGILQTARKTIRLIKKDIRELKSLNDAKLLFAGEEYDLSKWITISGICKKVFSYSFIGTKLGEKRMFHMKKVVVVRNLIT